MDLAAVVVRMRRNAVTLSSLVEGLGADLAAWTPPDGGWSIQDVIDHLHDEERLDFRVRLDLILRRPGEPWPAIDPEGWIAARQGTERDLGAALAGFRAERETSLAWLATLSDPDWGRACNHPSLGRLTAGEMLASWLAHDAFHTRQILKLLFESGRELCAPHGTDYAGGEW